MAKITRQAHKIFGGTGSSDNFSKFGSLVAGSPIKTKDLATIMSLAAWDEGFQSSIFGANKNLLLEDVNAFAYEHSLQVAYLFQQGIPEWDSETTYYVGSLVQAADGSGDVYKSKLVDNLNNTIPGHAGNAWWAWWNPVGSGFGLDADTVDGIHASATPVANKLLALRADLTFDPSVISGAILQVIRNDKNTYQTVSATIPEDDSIPQSTEGTEIITVSITPQSAVSRLRVTVHIPFTKNFATAAFATLFKDSETDARAVAATWQDSNGMYNTFSIDYEMVAGTTSPVTFKVRVGSVSAQTINLCGYVSGRLFGGIWKYSMQVQEIAA